MKVSITFPDGKTKVFTVKLRRGMTIEDIADEVAREMLREYRDRHTVKDPARYVEGVKRWLIPQLYSALLERYGGIMGGEEA